MNYSYLVILLLFSMIICLSIFVMGYIAYDEKYDGGFSETIKMFFLILDMLKDVGIIFCLLHLLYGILF